MAEKTGKIDIKSALEQKAKLVNSVIAAAVKDFNGIPDKLREAIEYTLSAPGKRIRAAVVLWCCEVAAGSINKDAEIAAAAITPLTSSAFSSSAFLISIFPVFIVINPLLYTFSGFHTAKY